MSRKSQNWLLIAAASLSLGSGIAITETFLGKIIDSLLPGSERVSKFNRPGTITLLSTKGNIIQKLGPATREKVENGKMPLIIKQAFIAAEDRRFYVHKGIDLWSISRAIVTNLRKRSVKEGGSTITQQLARIVFLSQERTLNRKFKEAALAFKLERQLSKEQIIEQYLNKVYLGSGAYGIADAAWVYFSKTPDNLSLEEASLIAGLAPAPSFYSPLVNPDLALKRRLIVLERMHQQGYISHKELSTGISKPLNLKPATPKYLTSKAPFFTSWAAKQLPELLTPEQLEVGGLSIRTSLNLDWQEKAREVLVKHSPEEMQSALVSIEPKTGLVRTLIGGKNFKNNQFNRATQALRSPGSTFKLFPYLAALESGYTAKDIFIDAPTCWQGYCPKNFGNRYMGAISMADALKYSLNTVAVQLLEKVGFEKVISTANKLGVGNRSRLGNYFPLAIGAYEQTVLDMTAAYAGVTNQGLYIKPNGFEEIRGPGGDLLWSHKIHHKKKNQAITKNSAEIMNWMLQRSVKDGTGIAASLKDRQVAGKTGTSEGGRDLWFIGSIPQLTTGIWYGYDNNKRTKSGSGEAAWTWKQFMLTIKDELEVLNFPSNLYKEAKETGESKN